MPDETEPTPAAVPPPDEQRTTDRTEATPTTGTGVHVPKWLAVGVVAVALVGGGFAIGRATGSEHHGGFAPIGDNRPGGDQGDGGGFGGRAGPGGDRTGPGPGGDSNSNNNDGSNGAPTTPSTMPGTTATTGA